jgi:hypothetical protein
MDAPELSVVAGALAGTLRPRCAAVRDAMAKRWRSAACAETEGEIRDVIPLLDGWIRRLERQAGGEREGDPR